MMSIRKQTEAGTKGRCSVMRNNKGFTLIELAIVLVIIGLILGSVLKGKDLINSAKQKQFYNAFVKSWELVIVSYYDRTGYLLDDGVNNGGVGTPNGTFDRANTVAEFTNVDSAISRVGLEVIVTNTANSWQTSFSGAYSGSGTISLWLIGPSANYLPNDNGMILRDVPIDLAYALDKMIDGQVDSAAGKCLLLGAAPAATWGDASTGNTVHLGIKVDML